MFTDGRPATAIPGETLSLFASGLGALDSNGMIAKPSVSVGGVPAAVVDTTLAGTDLYRFRFLVPPGDGLHLVSLTIGGQ